MKLLGGDEGALQLEILSLQHSSAPRSKHNDFWMKYNNVRDFPELSKLCKKVLTMFGSSYVYLAGFSAMTNIKSKKRNSLTDQHLEDLLRTAATQYQPAIKHIAGSILLRVINVHDLTETHCTQTYKYTTKCCQYTFLQDCNCEMFAQNASNKR